MRWMPFFAAAAVAAALCQPAAAARPGSQPAPAASDLHITFAQYRTWRLTHMERRRQELAAALAAGGLTPERRARLQHIKAYYDRLAALPAAERDRQFRQRFDRIDTDHDGTMDNAERAAWRAKRRAYYRRAYHHHAYYHRADERGAVASATPTSSSP